MNRPYGASARAAGLIINNLCPRVLYALSEQETLMRRKRLIQPTFKQRHDKTRCRIRHQNRFAGCGGTPYPAYEQQYKRRFRTAILHAGASQQIEDVPPCNNSRSRSKQPVPTSCWQRYEGKNTFAANLRTLQRSASYPRPGYSVCCVNMLNHAVIPASVMN